MASRYKADPNRWAVEETVTVGDVVILHEVTDALETYTDGHVRRWPDGAHRVSVKGANPSVRTKTFIGETAWSDAARLIGDIASDQRRKQVTW